MKKGDKGMKEGVSIVILAMLGSVFGGVVSTGDMLGEKEAMYNE